MNFFQKYELERLLADGETKSFRAVENSTGRNVFLHFFNPQGLSILAALKSKLEKTPGKPVLPLIELGEFAGSPYAVTERIVPFTTLREWVESLPSDGQAVISDTTETIEIPKPAPQPAAIPGNQAGEFTRVFETPKPAAPAASAEPPMGEFTRMFEAPVKPVPPAEPSMGEFTRMFESPKAPATPKAPIPPRPAAPVSNPSGGEFTRFFGGPSEPPKQSNAPAPQGGEFTQFFGAGAKAPTQPPRSAPQSPNAKPQDAGEFRQWFDPAPQAASQPAPQPRQYNEYQDLFADTSIPKAAKPNPSQANSMPNWPAPGPSTELETGQFTKLFGSGPSGEAINIEEEQARAARAKQPESRPFQAPSEFTRVFGREEAARASSAPAMQMDSASGIFGSLDQLKGLAPAAAPAQPAAGPGEYTRMTTRAELEAEQAALERTTSPAPAQKGAKRWLIIGLAVGSAVLVIVIIVLLVLAQKR